MKSRAKIIFLTFVLMVFFLLAKAGAAVETGSIPQPAPSAKLRIFAVVVTTEAKTSGQPVTWVVSQEKLQQFNAQFVRQLLQGQGIYEPVSEGDVYKVLGDRTISGWEWRADNMALLKKAGKALWADYALLFERSFKVHLHFDMKLINLNTGLEFPVSNYIPRSMLHRLTNEEKKQAGVEVIKISYRQLFTDAKSDLLRTAMIKGRAAAESKLSAQKMGAPDAPQPDGAEKPTALPAPGTPQQVLEIEPAKGIPEKPVTSPQALPTKKTVSPVTGNRQADFEKELQKVLSTKTEESGFPRLVVFDFDAADTLKVVGLILTESLREALLDAGGFVLVNRENMLKIMDEYKLQQSGAVDEAQAVKMGKWLAASEAITGQLAVLGATSVLQAKRIDIGTLGTITMGSLRCPSGREDELLNRMPELARKLTEKKEP
ncbi:MAG: CsgG/HfaB family protein [Smithellaceae bacterium]